ncbi:hypothetical protein BJY01DRAFT_248935 [Aspergillus pseudoustus]|uniref:Uncharacterized protein n=1 Tax=Aspergillus pseudoustus TaxID=1810923 RepID=A0ABR4JRY7_9EURO
MGHKVSAVTGVKSENFVDPGNAINEIWVGNTEVISRLPFGDSDMAQAGWPKIPWHNFIIPMKRDLSSFENLQGTIPYAHANWTTITQWPADKLICCNQLGCMTNNITTDYMFTQLRFNQDPTLMLVVWFLTLVTLVCLQLPCRKLIENPRYDPKKHYNARESRKFLVNALTSTTVTIIGLVFAGLTAALWVKAHYVYELKTWDHLLWEYGFYISVPLFALLSIFDVYRNWTDWIRITEEVQSDSWPAPYIGVLPVCVKRHINSSKDVDRAS